VKIRSSILICLAVAWSVSALPGPARAQPLHAAVSTRVDPCVPIDPDLFERLLAIELDVAPRGPGAVPPERSASVDVRCAGGLVSFTIEDELTGRSTRRRVDLRRVDPSARTRLLALTVAELLLASWFEVRLPKRERPAPHDPEPEPKSEAPWEPTPEPEPEPDSESAPRSEAKTPGDAGEQPEQQVEAEPELSDARALQLGAAGCALAFTSVFRLLPCAELRLTQPVAPTFALQFGLQVAYGSLSGRIEARAAEVRLLSASLQLALLYVARLGRTEVVAGPGGRIGLGHLAGVDPPDRSIVGEQTFAPWAGPLLAAGLRYRVSSQLSISLLFEAGLLALYMRALGPNDSVVTEPRGAWISASLGIDWSLSSAR